VDSAAEHGRLDAVELLLKFGAKCMEPGAAGYYSAIQFAKENGSFVIADILRGYKSRLVEEPFKPGWFEQLLAN
jgi:hypothetical protein